MKFTYQYKTSDGVRHCGEYVASDREAVFTELKSRGVRPFDVKLAPGLLNRIASIGKRGFAIVILAFLLVVVVIIGIVADLKSPTPEAADAVMLNALNSPMRRQVIGDEAIIDNGIRTGWSEVFSEPGDRYLASYAIPGVIGGVSTASVEQVRKVLDFTGEVPVDLTLEARQIVAMVGGLKDELREFLADGGSIHQFCRLMLLRQQEEIGYYNKAKGEIDHASQTFPKKALEELVEKRNADLRRMGIRPLILSERK